MLLERPAMPSSVDPEKYVYLQYILGIGGVMVAAIPVIFKLVKRASGLTLPEDDHIPLSRQESRQLADALAENAKQAAENVRLAREVENNKLWRKIDERLRETETKAAQVAEAVKVSVNGSLIQLGIEMRAQVLEAKLLEQRLDVAENDIRSLEEWRIDRAPGRR